MKKNELKKTLKPLIKECIKECIFEEGVLSGIITEVLAGMQTQRVVTEGITIKKDTGPSPEELEKREEEMERQKQERIKRLNESAKVGGVNIFEGVDSDTIAPEPGHGALSGVAPGDSGVDIGGILGLAGGKWKDLI
jgi:hypothetical protein|tara:strand:+ start:3098 stop:3508 length:411 start_codon:yes stop_codon:yes gene_type:complete